MNLLWAGLADSKYYEYIAKYCLPSWKNLPGDKMIIHDANDIKINSLDIVQWGAIPNMNSKFLEHAHSKKVSNFWRKMQSQIWTIRNFKNQYEYIILLDTDIEVHDFDNTLFLEKIDEFSSTDHIWMTGESQLRKLDAGFIVFKTAHPHLDELLSYYENIWESWKIFELRKPYDGDAVASMFELYPSHKMKNFDCGRGLHTYDIGLIHFGSKLPKQLRSDWGENNPIVLDQLLSKHREIISTW